MKKLDHAKPQQALFDLEPPDADTRDLVAVLKVLGAIALIVVGFGLFLLGFFR